jgi:acetyl esterase/lipase
MGGLAQFALGGCSGPELLNRIAADDGIRIARDLEFTAGPRGRLDVYAPAHAKAAPVVVFFYGGGWESGAKEEYRFLATALANRGLVVVVPDYRVYPEVRFPDFLEDAARAVRYARANVSAYGGDPSRIVLAGHSAGAYIAAMLNLDRRWLKQVGLDPRRDIAGAAGLAGPYDFLPLRSATLMEIFGPEDKRPATQPIAYVDGKAPPMLLATGKRDFTVEPGNSERLAARIKERGGDAELILYSGVGHITIAAAFSPAFRVLSPVLDDVARFAKSVPPAGAR